MKTERVTCDGCGGDLTHAARHKMVWVLHHRITRELPNYDDNHFCDAACLDQWSGRETFRAGLWKKWRSEECVPADSAELRDEFEAAALAAFPMRRVG
jgi:hypothetical protein